MNIEPRLWAVLLIGPPGAGKDTQAGLLSLELGLLEIKTSKIIEKKFAEADPNDAVIQEQKKRKASGELVKPDLVLNWCLEEMKNIQSTGKGIVTSGSPRTLLEAEGELPVLKELYGETGLKIIYINVSAEESVKRNSFRRVCEQNGHPIPNFPEYEGLAACPQDGSPIISRVDDAPETIKKRYQVYVTETKPILDFLTQKGYNVITIDGEQSIEDVHRSILNNLW
jgi:adenylate kinase